MSLTAVIEVGLLALCVVLLATAGTWGRQPVLGTVLVLLVSVIVSGTLALAVAAAWPEADDPDTTWPAA